MDGVESCLDLLQLLGGIGEGISGIPESLGGILYLIHEVFHPLMELRERIVKSGNAAQCPLRLCHQAGGTIGVIGAIQALHALVDGIGELFGVLQHLSPGFQGIVLPDLQIGAADLVDLKAQGLHAAELLALVHRELGDLPPELGYHTVALLIGSHDLLIVCEGIQENKMVLLVKEGGAVVLAVDVDELHTQLM